MGVGGLCGRTDQSGGTGRAGPAFDALRADVARVALGALPACPNPPPTPNTHTQPPNPTAANKPKNTLRPHPEDRLATLQCNMRDAQFATIFSALGNALPRLTIEEMLFVAYSRTAPNMKGIGMLDALDAGNSGRAPSERFATSRDWAVSGKDAPYVATRHTGKRRKRLSERRSSSVGAGTLTVLDLRAGRRVQAVRVPPRRLRGGTRSGQLSR